MSRICDFCDKSEHELEKMVERKPEEKMRNEMCASHICIECARRAVACMEESIAAVEGDIS